MSRGIRAFIDLQALHHNFLTLKSLAPQQKILSMIKANAYGHGAIQVANTLSGSDGFGVTTLEEAKELRQAGIQNPIVMMGGCYDKESLSQAIELQLDLVIHTMTQLKQLENIDHRTTGNKQQTSIVIWLKTNTGMNRLGFPSNQTDVILLRLKQLSICREIRLLTHLATAQEPESMLTKNQMQCFKNMTDQYDFKTSICNSAALLSGLNKGNDWIRPGIALYGINPTNHPVHLKPVMTLTAKIIDTRICAAGECIGYDGTYVAIKEMLCGIVSIGYGDGYPRSASNKATVVVRGKKCPVIGRVSMDYLMIDLSVITPKNNQELIGETVTLWGKGLPIETVASQMNMSPYEMITQLTRRAFYVWA